MLKSGLSSRHFWLFLLGFNRTPFRLCRTGMPLDVLRSDKSSVNGVPVENDGFLRHVFTSFHFNHTTGKQTLYPIYRSFIFMTTIYRP